MITDTMMEDSKPTRNTGENNAGDAKPHRGKEVVVDPTQGETARDVEHSPVQGLEPPNGGFFAWLQVCGSLMVYFNCWGVISSYGAFQSYYQSHLLSSHTPFQISVIGSVQSFIMMSLGCVTGPIYDAGYFRHLLMGGTVLIVAGTFTQSICRQFWQLLLVQGVVIGLGSGALSVMAVAVIGKWFSTRLPVATGIASLGSGIGGIVIPILFRTLQSRVGFGWAVRILGFLFTVTLGFSNLVMRTHLPAEPKPAKTRHKLIDKESFSDVPYLLFVSGCFVAFLGMYTPFVYVGEYARDTSLIADEEKTSYVLALLNLASILGRIIPNLLARRIGTLNMIFITTISLSVSACSFSAVTNVAELLVVTSVYGFWTGGFFALQPTVIVHLTESKAVVGKRIGFAFLLMSFSMLFGPPVAGALVESDGYSSAWFWAGGNMLVAAFLIGVARGVKGGWQVQAIL